MGTTHSVARAITPCIFVDRVPTEVRAQIFSYVLAREEPIYFRYTLPKNAEGQRKRKWVIDNDGSLLPGPDLDNTTALLRTCKTFRAEASEVLFSTNSFVFPSTTAVTKFLEEIGAPKHAIKALIIERYVLSTAEQFWHSLVPLVNLRTITLPHYELCQTRARPVKLHAVQQYMEPLLEVLHAARTAREKDVDLRSLIRLKVSKIPCWWCRNDHRLKDFRDPHYDQCTTACGTQAAAAEHAKLVGRIEGLIAATMKETQEKSR
nr:hypothetical protein B0A51_11925 [Rachicladosporium sp. CCFEE 5018]